MKIGNDGRVRRIRAGGFIIKTPLRVVRTRPPWTVNAIASTGCLAPAVLALMLYDRMTHQGEVRRIYARTRSANTWSKVGTQ